MQVKTTKKSMGTLTIEDRNNPDIHWVVLTTMVVKLAHGNCKQIYVYKQQHSYMYTHVPTHVPTHVATYSYKVYSLYK